MSEIRQISDSEFKRLVLVLSKRSGVDLFQYKPEQLKRRLQNELFRRKFASVEDLLRYFSPHNGNLEALISSLTINVTEVNRDPKHFEHLADYALKPLLAKRTYLKIWSAGCSYGAEAVTVAIYLQELKSSAWFRILGTDLDPAVVERARTLTFCEADLKNLSPELRRKYFVETEAGFTFCPKLKRRFDFKRHDLLEEPYPSPFDLILFRNVAIYFRPEATAQIHAKLAASLASGGYLFVGATEHVDRPENLELEPVAPFIYRKA